MRGEQLDWEFLAREVRGRAGVAEDELPLAAEIAVRLLGPTGLIYGHPAAGARLEGHTVLVPKNHPDQNFVIAHELGEWALKHIARFRGESAKKEEAANYIAAAIIAPRPAVKAAYECFGEDVATMGRAFAMSCTATVLRLAEVRGDERAVVTSKSQNVIVRNPQRVDWADPKILRVAGRLARGGSGSYPGLVKTAVFDLGIDRGRVAFRAT